MSKPWGSPEPLGGCTLSKPESITACSLLNKQLSGEQKHWMLKNNLHFFFFFLTIFLCILFAGKAGIAADWRNRGKKNQHPAILLLCFLCEITLATARMLWKKNSVSLNILLCGIPHSRYCFVTVLLSLHLADKSAHGYIEAHPSVSVNVTFSFCSAWLQSRQWTLASVRSCWPGRLQGGTSSVSPRAPIF